MNSLFALIGGARTLGSSSMGFIANQPDARLLPTTSRAFLTRTPPAQHRAKHDQRRAPQEKNPQIGHRCLVTSRALTATPPVPGSLFCFTKKRARRKGRANQPLRRRWVRRYADNYGAPIFANRCQRTVKNLTSRCPAPIPRSQPSALFLNNLRGRSLSRMTLRRSPRCWWP
jgi:hypothetical protein